MPELINTELAALIRPPRPARRSGRSSATRCPIRATASWYRADRPGSVQLHGYVYDGDGNGVEDALLEIRQADTSGAIPAVPGSRARWCSFYRMGRSSTDADGHYWFSTVEPGPARPGSAPFFGRRVRPRPAQPAVHPGLPAAEPAVLDADPLLASLDAAERRAMMAVREADGSLRFDVYLQGPRETPFLSFPGHLR